MCQRLNPYRASSYEWARVLEGRFRTYASLLILLYT
jgi:hypothetical protein